MNQDINSSAAVSERPGVRHLVFTFACAAAIFAAGCSPKTIALRTTSSLLVTGASAFYEESDPVLAEQAMASNLKLLEGLLKSEPDNRDLLRLTAEGFNGYSFLFLEDSQPQRARELYWRGRQYGFRLLALNHALADLDSKPLADLQDKLKQATREDVPGLFWAAYGWAGWINLSKDSPEAVAGLPKAAAMMARVQELSPGYYFSGPDLFLGVYYASIPKMLGGDPEKSKAHFEAAIKATGGRFLTAKTLYAQYYAVAAQDPGLFRELNEAVLKANESWPEARLANAVAKIKSKRLLEKQNELF